MAWDLALGGEQLQCLAPKSMAALVSQNYCFLCIHDIRASWDQVRHKTNQHVLCTNHWLNLCSTDSSRMSLLSALRCNQPNWFHRFITPISSSTKTLCLMPDCLVSFPLQKTPACLCCDWFPDFLYLILLLDLTLISGFLDCDDLALCCNFGFWNIADFCRKKQLFSFFFWICLFLEYLKRIVFGLYWISVLDFPTSLPYNTF